MAMSLTSKSEEAVRCRIFIGNLPTDQVTKESMRQVFSQYGNYVDCSIYKNFGFVQFSDEKSARDAVAGTNHTVMHDRRLDVKIASNRSRDGPSQPQRPQNGQGVGKSRKDPENVRPLMPREPSGYSQSSMPGQQSNHGQSSSYPPNPGHSAHQPYQFPGANPSGMQNPYNIPQAYPSQGQSQHPSRASAPPPHGQPPLSSQYYDSYHSSKGSAPPQNNMALSSTNPPSIHQRSQPPDTYQQNGHSSKNKPLTPQNNMGKSKQGNLQTSSNSGIPESDKRFCDIICTSKKLFSYAEFVEYALSKIGLVCNINLLCGSYPMESIIKRLARDSALFAVVLKEENEAHHSISLHTFGPKPEEHRNMPVDVAEGFLKDKFFKGNSSQPPKGATERSFNYSMPNPPSVSGTSAPPASGKGAPAAAPSSNGDYSQYYQQSYSHSGYDASGYYPQSGQYPLSGGSYNQGGQYSQPSYKRTA